MVIFTQSNKVSVFFFQDWIQTENKVSFIHWFKLDLSSIVLISNYNWITFNDLKWIFNAFANKFNTIDFCIDRAEQTLSYHVLHTILKNTLIWRRRKQLQFILVCWWASAFKPHPYSHRVCNFERQCMLWNRGLCWSCNVKWHCGFKPRLI